MQTWIALLRGINVGGNSKVPMKELRTWFEDAGCENVRTWIQSGNVVFTAPDPLAERIPDIIATRISKELGVKTWLVLRNREELQRIVQDNPFAHLNAPDTSVAVAFLTGAPPENRLDFMQEHPEIPDKVIIRGNNVYLYLPNGFSKSKLDPKFFSKSLKNGTTRNWRTVTKLLAMSEES
jgi:uncharacterized protein (DUF1697 family)